jgi:hypothetical protein
MNADKKRILGTIVSLLVFSIFLVYPVVQDRINKEKSLIMTLELYEKEIGSACPIDVGNRNELMLQKVFFVKKRTLVHEYQWLNYNKSDFDIQQLKENLSEPIIQELESDESLSALRNKNVIFEYRYFDNQNEEMFRLKALYNTPITIIDDE